MKKIYLLVLLNIIFNYINAQNFQWAKVEGHYAYDYGYGIATDSAGNVYIAGKYEENAVFSGVVLPNQGNHDIYVAQYSPAGNLNWIRTGGGFNGDYAHALTCNKTSNVYIAGEVEDGNALITFPGSTITLHPKGNNDVFIASYDLAGNLIWARTDGYIYNEKALGIACDNSGNIAICGYFRDTTMFGSNYSVSNGEEDMFVAKYDASGNFLWMRNAGGPGREEGKSVVCDTSGNIYVCGMYSDNAVFGSSTHTTATTSFGNFYNGYMAKYDPNGNLLWVKDIGGDYTDVAWSITKDNAGKLYVAGEFSGAKFDTTDVVVWTNGKADAFVACYDQNGNFQWVNYGGGSEVDRARGIGCDGTTIFLTGQYGLNGTFGSYSLNAADSSDIFVAALDNSGNFLWANTVGGVADAFDTDGGYESGNAVCGHEGITYATGSLLNGGVFGGGSFPGYTHTDVFLTKLSSAVGIQEITPSNISRLFPNPVKEKLTIDLDKTIEKGELIIYNALGQTMFKEKIDKHNTFDLSEFESGLYIYVMLQNKQQIQSGKLVIE
ncbi:MAG: T9SS type A sorting domain-containing protein [Bacteroidia bacterium]